jgi:NAD(P)-dependent dehydrogenase (short-subunit alcohol dehydrogenase family)
MADPASSTGVRFDGQVAIVTGAGRGLGAAYARLLAGRGAAVVVHDAGVAADGSGFDPAVADTVVREIMSRGGTAVGCHEKRPRAVTVIRRSGKQVAEEILGGPSGYGDQKIWETDGRKDARRAGMACRDQPRVIA